jgi:hypothetical protein
VSCRRNRKWVLACRMHFIFAGTVLKTGNRRQ